MIFLRGFIYYIYVMFKVYMCYLNVGIINDLFFSVLGMMKLVVNVNKLRFYECVSRI